MKSLSIYSKSIFILILCILAQESFAQNLQTLTPLDVILEETSGLISLEGRLITINDSGGSPTLFEVDKQTGNVLRSVTVENASNKDWEAITTDSNYIYIGDFGNNQGTRKDLMIYRIPIAEYLNSQNNMVLADTILFSYADQTDFTPSDLTTNYDAESLIAFGNSLYIFSKNWGNSKSYIYSVPKTPGDYQLLKLDSIDADGLVTDATYNPDENEIILIGHSLFTPFTIRISKFTFNDFANGTINRINLLIPEGYTFQIEGITVSNKDEYYVTCEANFLGDAGLFILKFGNVSTVEDFRPNSGIIYPNPASDKINISHSDYFSTSIYDLKGGLILNTKENKIDLLNFEKGIYLVLVFNKQGLVIGRMKLKVE